MQEKVESGKRKKEVGSKSNSCLHPLLLEITLFAENATAHLKDGFKSLTANLGIFPESFYTCFLDFVLDFLPPTTESRDFRFLVKFGCGGRVEGGLPVSDGLANAENI